ncbi:MAG: ABC transporter ATP-binding protein [Deltaproteobacteria bacterium]|nr:ABC transporter ATP-binding protein [Deltaproteobacteria bacterium]MBI4373356.1 ABC transporter ATP-binding protein [Deltaproteobacteria bacterium]
MKIQIEYLSKQFNGYEAVSNVSFSVSDGEFVTLLGPSGSGKSTILRLIAGLEMPDAGIIEVNGEDVTRVPVQERKVGFVFQHYALFHQMNVLDNIAFGLKVRGVQRKAREAKARELLALVGLSGLERRMPSQLSGGQRQRVALARALAPEPGLLLLDEPFGALDARLRKELRTWLKKLHDRIKLTTLLVTHDQDEALELSDKVLVMNRGRIEQEAVPQAVFDHPATEFVAAFVGETNRVKTIAKNGEVSWGTLRFGSSHLEDGSPATVLFRPNDVYVSSQPGEAEAPGTIRSIQFLGATESLEIDLGDNRFITAHVPTGVAEQSEFVVGKKVYVAVTRSHIFFSLGSI